MLYVGEVPEGMDVCHSCDVRACVNPAHLFLGTRQQNMSDCRAKGRQTVQKGEKNSQARLSDEDVYLIRMSFASGAFTTKELAEEFSISRWYVREIVSGRRRR